MRLVITRHQQVDDQEHDKGDQGKQQPTPATTVGAVCAWILVFIVPSPIPRRNHLHCLQGLTLAAKHGELMSECEQVPG